MTASEILDLIASQFSSSPSKDSFLTLARGLTSSCAFGTNYEQAVALRAAHMMTLAARTSGSPGAATSKAEGGMSIGYAAPSGVSGDLSQTQYGVQLDALIRSCVTGISVTGSSIGGMVLGC